MIGRAGYLDFNNVVDIMLSVGGYKGIDEESIEIFQLELLQPWIQDIAPIQQALKQSGVSEDRIIPLTSFGNR